MPSRPELERSFSQQYEDHNADRRKDRRRNKEKDHGAGAKQREFEASKCGAEGPLSVQDLRRNQALQPLLALPRRLRQRLVGAQRPQIGKAMEKVHDLMRKNRKNCEKHAKGRQQQGGWGGQRNPLVLMDPDVMREDVHGLARPRSTYQRSGRVVEPPPDMTKIKSVERALLMQGFEMRKDRDEGKTSAAAQRAEAVAGGRPLPSAPEALLRRAAKVLRALKPEQRPTSTEVLARWFRSRGVCSMDMFSLMPPGDLVEAMLHLLTDTPSLKAAVAPFAVATGGDALGPSAGLVQPTAARAVQRLRLIKDQFFGMGLAARCRWITEQSYSTLALRGEELVAELARRRLILPVGDGDPPPAEAAWTGRLRYDEEALAAVELPGEFGTWLASDFPLEAVCVKQHVVSLGSSQYLQELAAMQIRHIGGLAKFVARWRNSVKSMIGVGEEGDGEHGVVNVKVRAAFDKHYGPTSIIISVAALSGKPSEAIEEVIKFAEADISDCHPACFELGVKLRRSLFHGHRANLHMLEARLQCSLVQSDDEVWVVLHGVRGKDASSEYMQVCREVLIAIASDSPAFQCEGVVQGQWAESLKENLGPIELANDVHYEVAETPSGKGYYDLLGWPDAEAFGFTGSSLEDLRQALARYRSAAETHKRAGIDALIAAATGTTKEMFEDGQLWDKYTDEFVQAKLRQRGAVAFGRR
mmetsp:Transcript_147198/g.470449  ORF Transcript_147198/g.470449 Transcript_147198/m.470449 type:complete len:699 (+) Transcript_147198:86-2182(+)